MAPYRPAFRRQPALTDLDPTASRSPIVPVGIADRAVRTSLVPAGYGSTQDGPSAGAVVGITLGAVAGFLLIVALVWTCANYGTLGLLGRRRSTAGSTFFASTDASSVLDGGSYVRHRAHRSSSRRSHRSTRSTRERSEKSRTRRHTRHHSTRRARPVIVDPPMERVVRTEEHVHRVSRGPPAPVSVSVAHSEDDSDEIVVMEEGGHRASRHGSHVPSEDEIVVIEEGSDRPSRAPRSSRPPSSRR